MSEHKQESYSLAPPEPSQQFLQARNIAGTALQGEFNRAGGKVDPSKDYKWLKAELTWPSLDHLTFAYGNQVFSVLVELVDGQDSSLTQQERDRCIEGASEHNLVPCVFRVNSSDMTPLSDGWNLENLVTHGKVIPEELATAEKIRMSEWELRNFTIQIVCTHITNEESGTVLSFSDMIGIDPQVWFEDTSGNRNWAIVRHYAQINGNEKEQWFGYEKTNSQLKKFGGFFAAVSLASAEPVLHDEEGNIIPLSERFSGAAPLFRGDGFHIKFEGLQRIYDS